VDTSSNNKSGNQAALRLIWVLATITTLVVFFTIISDVKKSHAVHPNMYINSDEIAAIKSKISAGEQPWKNAFDTMLADANKALSQSSYSVTFQGSASNTFYSESPYCGWTAVDGGRDCRDGQINPQADRGDYEAAIKLSWAMRNLALAYAFTNDPKYAEKALTLIRTWTIDPDTYMKPGRKSGSGAIIELLITIPGLYYGADLIWNYPAWDAAEKSAFLGWVSTYTNYVSRMNLYKNNFSNWQSVLVASGGALLGDKRLMNRAFDLYKFLVPLQIDVNGYMIKESSRTKGLSYSLFAINAMIQTAEIAKHQGIDLYNYKLGDGRGLELALDRYVQFSKDPSTWNYQQIRVVTSEDIAPYELAYSYFHKPAYLDVVQKWGRPIEEKRVIGPVTLTHANKFKFVLKPIPPSRASNVNK
jgi:hypothetical protein